MKKKSLVGWVRSDWTEYFFKKGRFIFMPLICSSKKETIKGKNIRITIEELT